MMHRSQDLSTFNYFSHNRSHRYGFQGQEMDNEITGSSYTAEFWQYDSRLGRRWNVDPVVYPWQSSYALQPTPVNYKLCVRIFELSKNKTVIN
jgi:hypothetical protein